MAKKSDPAHIATDAEIAKLEKLIAKEYKKAHKEVSKKLDDYLAAFATKDEKWQEWVAAGTKTQKEYKEWRTGQMMIGKRWKDLVDSLAADYTNAAKIAQSITKGFAPEVYAINHNYATFDVEKKSLLDTSYSLYSRESVEHMYKGKPKLYHTYGKAVAKEIKEGKQRAWDRRRITSVLHQAIVQGESIPNVTKRLEQVTKGDHKAAIRNARTMMTGVQNAGRVDAYERAKGLGIPVRKQWLATLDTRTRHWHRELDGVIVESDEPFENEFGKIMFPGDPEAHGCNVYNCRCTLLAAIEGFELNVRDPNVRPMPKLGDMTYEEWLSGKKVASQATTKQKAFAKLNSSETKDSNYKGLLSTLEKRVGYNQVTRISQKETPEQIINALSGGDRTKGSCASVGLCYIGRKNGLDVLDFRGGASQDFFSRSFNLVTLSRAKGIKRISADGKSSLTVGNRLLKQCEEGKEYYLVCGRHASIVRRLNDELEYLELQSATKSGWTKFNGNPRNTLARRFGCSSSSEYLASEANFMIDLQESDFDTDEFRTLLGYMNTSSDDQIKGEHGTIK